MCRSCYRVPDFHETPKDDQPDPIFHCEYCGYGIYEDEEYAEIGSNRYHIECLSNEMNIYELLDMLDVTVMKAVAE